MHISSTNGAAHHHVSHLEDESSAVNLKRTRDDGDESKRESQRARLDVDTGECDGMLSLLD